MIVAPIYLLIDLNPTPYIVSDNNIKEINRARRILQLLKSSISESQIKVLQIKRKKPFSSSQYSRIIESKNEQPRNVKTYNQFEYF